jgi:cytochrome b
MQTRNYAVYQVWDLPTRIFHWVNVLLVLLLFLQGMMIMFRHELGFDSPESKLALKELHVILGYLFALNLAVRFVWAFVGNRYARWSGFLVSPDSFRAAWSYVKGLLADRPDYYIGHNPAGRLAVSAMFLLLLVVAATGIVRASTDLYYPPFGGVVAAYVAAQGVDPASLTATADKALLDEARYRKLSRYKIPVGKLHIYASYLLMIIVILHVAAVVVTEKRKAGLVSAMVSGVRLLPAGQRPVDE